MGNLSDNCCLHGRSTAVRRRVSRAGSPTYPRPPPEGDRSGSRRLASGRAIAPAARILDALRASLIALHALDLLWVSLFTGALESRGERIAVRAAGAVRHLPRVAHAGCGTGGCGRRVRIGAAENRRGLSG
jgi:hypothetical protein